MADSDSNQKKSFNMKKFNAAKAAKTAVPPPRPTPKKRHGNYKGGTNISASIFGGWRRRAKRDNIKFALTIDQLDKMWSMRNGHCVVTGRQMTTTKNDPHKVSLDRVDSSKDYELANVRLVCASVNFARHTMTDDELRDLLQDMVYIDSLRKKLGKTKTGGSWYTRLSIAEYKRIFGRTSPDVL
jgi:hypothetical protein